MFQKRYDLEILIFLYSRPTHLRKIATDLNIPIATVMRLLRRLERENVVDYYKEGKNHRYFLKNSLEATEYMSIAQHYKLLKVVDNPLIRKITKELKIQTNGELIILFGSYAKNSATQKSDVDVYIETKNLQLKEKLRKISEKLSITIGKFEKNSELGKEIVNNGIVIQNLQRWQELLKN